MANLSIKYKLLLWFVPLLMLTAGAIGFYSYSIATGQVLDKISQEQKSASALTISHLDYIAQDIYDIYNYLYLSSDLQDMYRRTPDPDNDSSLAAFATINRLMSTRQFFHSLIIYSDAHKTLDFNRVSYSSVLSYEKYKQTPYYAATMVNPSRGIWGVENDRFHLYDGDRQHKLFFSRILLNSINMDAEGILVIGINEAEVRQAYTGTSSASTILVLDEQGNILSDSEGRWVGKPFSVLPFFTKPFHEMDWSRSTGAWLISRSQSKLTGWNVVIIQPRDDLIHALNQIRKTTGMILIATLLLSMALIWLFSSKYVNRLSLILRSMRELQKGDFEQRVVITGNDEIGQLSHGYNIMVDRIKGLISDVYAYNLTRKEAELRLLQSQVNPHFLYNILNSIAWTAHQNGDHQVSDMVYRLSGFFRLSLNEGQDLITLEKEFLLVESYLYLQGIRFGDKISYSLDVSPELASFCLPKLTLQPIVENAIVHGLESSADCGFISLKAYYDIKDHVIVIQVTDNGVGMTAEKLMSVQSMLGSSQGLSLPGDRKGFALVNIAQRLGSYFGERVEMTLQSTELLGTTVMIRIRKEEHADV